MSDISDSLPETDYDRAMEGPEEFDRPYDDVFLPNGDKAPVLSILDLIVDPVTGEILQQPLS